MPSVLFVCTGNLVRSPMAAALFQSLLAQHGQNPTRWRVESAGVWAGEDMPAERKAQTAMQELGLDLSQHRSRPVSHPLLQAFDLVLTMERSHKEALWAAFPDLANRIHFLGDLVGQTRDVHDPILGSMEDFRDTARELSELLEKSFAMILNLLTGPPADSASRS